MRLLMIWFFCCLFFSLSAQEINQAHLHILYTPGTPANKFIPAKNIGAAFDAHEKGDIEHMLTPGNIKAMRSVGLSPLSYRLRTELQGEIWHWNPKGTWSEESKQQGYWVSDSLPCKPINISNGYFLPRRGNTIDQGNNEGYSKLDDGDQNTFWKSNPYLDVNFTRESNAVHPQWIVVDLGKLTDVNAVKINWGDPYAAAIKVEYALDIGSDYFEPFQPGLWHSFSGGDVNGLKGENKIITVSDKPVKARLIRINLMQSSCITTKNSSDIRDRLGFAVKEVEVGLLKAGKFTDRVKHATDHRKQSEMYVSSTDPWHRAIDIDVNAEQAGIDKFFNCGLTGDQPTLMPVGLLYDTPENMESMLKYLIAKKYPVEELEMGEEPEGQWIAPVDYASLYLQWANKLKVISPNIRFGGPGFATLAFTEDDISGFSEGKWTSVFLDYLKKHSSIALFNFFSFEWYPFDDVCAETAPQLAAAPHMLDVALKDIMLNVLPGNIPVYLTEYGYSAFSAKAEVEIEGALMYADILGKFITLGGDKSFLYGYEPAYLETDGCDWGNDILFGLDDNGKIEYRTAAYYGMRMLAHYWLQPANSLVEVYPVTTGIESEKDQTSITAYAVLKPGGKWSLMVINKDPLRTRNVNVDIEDTVLKTSMPFQPSQAIQYSKQQYQWVNNGSRGHPSVNLPPVIKKIKDSTNISLPPYSLTILN
jgi:hypothetical protein